MPTENLGVRPDGAWYAASDVRLWPIHHAHHLDDAHAPMLAVVHQSGVRFEHRVDQKWCAGIAQWCWSKEESRAHLWTVMQETPLSLLQSLICVRHGMEGFIRDGAWVPVDESAAR